MEKISEENAVILGAIQKSVELGLLPKYATPDEQDITIAKYRVLCDHLRPLFVEWERAEGLQAKGRAMLSVLGEE